MVDVGVSTEEPEKCDVATMTDNEIVGHETNADEASLLENAQWCESVPFGGLSRWRQWQQVILVALLRMVPIVVISMLMTVYVVWN